MSSRWNGRANWLNLVRVDSNRLLGLLWNKKMQKIILQGPPCSRFADLFVPIFLSGNPGLCWIAHLKGLTSLFQRKKTNPRYLKAWLSYVVLKQACQKPKTHWLFFSVVKTTFFHYTREKGLKNWIFKHCLHWAITFASCKIFPKFFFPLEVESHSFQICPKTLFSLSWMKNGNPVK